DAVAVRRPGAQRVAERAVELDLAGGHAAGAELLLQAADAVPVGRTVLEHPRHQVQAEAGRAVGCALGPGEQHDGGAVDVRAEPLLAGDLDPAVADVTS